MSDRILRLGVVGLGRAFMLMLPTFQRDPRVALVAAADPRPEARAKLAKDFGAKTYASADELCADPRVEAVYIATPHELHAAAVEAATAHGKHVLVEKPMALTLDECRSMIDAANRAGVHMIVGHSHSFDLPYLHARALIESAAFGRLRMIHALNFTDFLYRPRRPEELDTTQGGGVVFSQAAHQVDVVRLLAGSRVRGVRAATGAWDPARPTEGAYSAFLTFEGGAFATLTYSGYGRFDTDELSGWIGESGQPRDPEIYGGARELLKKARNAGAEAALKNARAYGAGETSASSARSSPQGHNHFGLVIASCERGDLRPLPQGVMIYSDDARRLDPLPPPPVPRAEVIDELYAAVLDGRPPLHDGAWGMATLEICLAILRSAEEQREVML